MLAIPACTDSVGKPGNAPEITVSPSAWPTRAKFPEEQIRFHEDRNRLLRSLGGRPDTRAELGQLNRAPRVGEAFLLASDGFWEWITEAEMQRDLRSWGPKGWLKKMEARIQATAPAGNDSYSAIGVLVRSTMRWM